MTRATSDSLDAARAGALNLLLDCIGAAPGDELLSIRPESGFYQDEAVDVFEQVAREHGVRVHALRTPGIAGPEQMPAVVLAAIGAARHTVFFHTLGGMLRFIRIETAGTVTNSFTTDLRQLGGTAAIQPYAYQQARAAALQASMNTVSEWVITCPAGTHLQCRVAPVASAAGGDGFTVRQFPIGTHRPVPGYTLNGQLALRWLVGSGVHDHGFSGIKLKDVVIAQVRDGRLADLQGAAHDVLAVQDFYAHVRAAHDYGEDWNLVSSWHGGTNPEAFCTDRDLDDLERWSVLAHSNPRLVHFHTCGDFNPGEITLYALDPTITGDGHVYWRDGRLQPETVDLAGLARAHGLESGLPAVEIGIDG